MKTSHHRIGKILGTLAIGGFLMNPSQLSAQEPGNREPQPGPPHRHGAPGDAPEARRPQPERLMQKIAELHRAGKHDEARQLQERIRRAAADGNPRVEGRPEAPPVERKPQPQADERKMPTPPKAGPPAQDRIRHLREAAEHLKAAGFEKQSAQARAEIARIEAENRPKEDECCCDEGSKANAAIKEELNKLRREMEELRGQVRRLSAEATPKHAPQSPERPEPRGDRRPESR